MTEQIFDYARKNLAKIEIFIKDPYVSMFVTEEKITEMAFVGSIGGVLGLFLGFSFISSVEVVFLVCLRPLFKKLDRKHFYCRRKPKDPIINVNVAETD